MTQIKFGTDGWRAIIAREYTVDNVIRVAEGTGKWMLSKGMSQVVIGHDPRFGGQMFSETTARTLGAMGIKSLLAKGFVSTPMVSLGAVKTGSDLGIVITASHNPPSYNGFKLKSRLGGPLSAGEVSEVEALVPDTSSLTLPSLGDLESQGLLEYVDLEKMYMDHLSTHFDLAKIQSSGIRIAYDAMYGAGQRVMASLFPTALKLHCHDNPSFGGRAPEPIDRNLQELSKIVKYSADIQLGIANDGDADRIGLFNSSGQFVDSNHILLLILLYLVKYRGQTGKVVFTFSVTDRMEKMAQMLGLDYEITKIGFKYIADIMAREDVVVGGEESGGLAVKGHIPERDGVWIALMLIEFMAYAGKSLEELVQEVYDMVGSFACDRDDLHITEELKLKILQNAKDGSYTTFGPYTVQQQLNLDGHKFILDDNSWILIRPSGTEPILRVYAQATDAAAARKILDAANATLLG